MFSSKSRRFFLKKNESVNYCENKKKVSFLSRIDLNIQKITYMIISITFDVKKTYMKEGL